jgi:hypothetical protein
MGNLRDQIESAKRDLELHLSRDANRELDEEEEEEIQVLKDFVSYGEEYLYEKSQARARGKK